MSNLALQRSFIAAHVTRKMVTLKPNVPKKKKFFSLKFTFQPENSKAKVSKKFFLATLDLSAQFVNTTMTKITSAGTVEPEKRTLPSSRKLSSELKSSIRQHITKFPTVPSQYCRKDTNRQYLQQGLNVAEMHRLYKEDCERDKLPSAKHWVYDHIFHTEFNLSFYQPKKEQCDLCTKFEKSSDAEKIVLKNEMERHKFSKELSRKAKDDAKLMAQQDSQCYVACFDLQLILVTTKSTSSQLYYKRNLATYNLSIPETRNKQGLCYMWHEGIGKRGAINIASCVYNFIIERHSTGVKKFVFFRNNCGGQYKNKTIVSMYIHAVRTLQVTTEHFYLKRGHIQNKADSIHATIEKASKNIDMFCPQQWYTVVQIAKKSNPQYVVKEMEGFMLNFDDTSSHYCMSVSKDISGT